MIQIFHDVFRDWVYVYKNGAVTRITQDLERVINTINEPYELRTTTDFDFTKSKAVYNQEKELCLELLPTKINKLNLLLFEDKKFTDTNS